MLNVPKKANDAMHLSMLEGLEDSLEALGEVILQDNFTVWDPKQLIKKGRERHIFLFDMCLIFAKESKDSNGKTKYMYKFKLMVSSWEWMRWGVGMGVGVGLGNNIFIPPAKQSFQHVQNSVILSFCQHLRFLLNNFDSFCPILLTFTPHLNHQDSACL